LHITQKDTWNKITHHARETFAWRKYIPYKSAKPAIIFLSPNNLYTHVLRYILVNHKHITNTQYSILYTHMSLVPFYLNMYNTHVIRTSSPHTTVKAYSRF